MILPDGVIWKLLEILCWSSFTHMKVIPISGIMPLKTPVPWLTNKQANKQTNNQTNKQPNKQTNNQTNNQPNNRTNIFSTNGPIVSTRHLSTCGAMYAVVPTCHRWGHPSCVLHEKSCIHCKYTRIHILHTHVCVYDVCKCISYSVYIYIGHVVS